MIRLSLPSHKKVLLIAAWSILALLGVILISYGEECKRHICSDDTVSGGEVWGNEMMKWTYPRWDDDPCDNTEECLSRCYEIGFKRNDDILTIAWKSCGFITTKLDGTLIYHDPKQYFNPYQVPTEYFPRVGDYYDYYVRVWEGEEISEWTADYVEYRGGRWVCFDGSGPCRVQCFPYQHNYLGMPSCE